MILFLYGEDAFRSREKLAEIKNKFLEKTSSGSVPGVVDFEENKNAKISEKIGTGGLFSEKRLIIVKNLLNAPESVQGEALEFFKGKKYLAGDKNTVVVFWESGVPKKGNDVFKYLLKFAKAQNFEKLTGAKLSSWVLERLKKENPEIGISKIALEKLIFFCGGDADRLDSEIKKLGSYKEKGEISENDIELLVKAEISANIFETIEALSSGDKKKALRLLHNQMEQDEDPFYVLNMYVYQFRNLLKIGDFYFQGGRDKNQIARQAKIHPYVVQKGMAQLKNFTFPKLKNVYQKLAEIDLGAKTGKISNLELALDKFVVEM